MLARRADGLIIDVNSAACDLIDRERDELLKCCVHELLEFSRTDLSPEAATDATSVSDRDSGLCTLKRTGGLDVLMHVDWHEVSIGEQDCELCSLREFEAFPVHQYEHHVDGVTLIVDDQVVFANEALCRLTGRSIEEIVGARPETLLVSDDQQTAAQRRKKLLAGDIEYPGEYLLLRPDQTVVPVEVRSRAVSWRGRPGLVSFVRNLTVQFRNEALLRGQTQVLQKLAAGRSLGDVLDGLVLTTEELFDGMKASVLLLDSDGESLVHGAAPSLPEDYNGHIDGLKIGPNVGSCGTAAYRSERVVVEDTQSDPLWSDYRELAVRFGLSACWSQPITSGSGQLLGTFAMYYAEAKGPSDAEIEVIEVAANLAGIAIERSRSLEALTESEARFRQFAENIESAFWVFDAMQQRIAYTSPAHDIIFGRPSHEFMQDPEAYLLAVVPEDRAMVDAKIARQNQGESTSEEYRIARPDGEVRWIRDRAFPIRDDTGKVVRVVGVADDITNLKDTEELLQSQRDQLAHVARLSTMGEMAAELAHEMNQPLAAIKNFAFVGSELLKQDSPDMDRVAEILSIVGDQSTRAAEIVKRVRNFSAYEELQVTPASINVVVEDALRLLETNFRRDSVRLELSLDQSIPDVPIDLVQMQQVVVNVLRNALDAMSETAPESRRLSISTVNVANGIEAVFEDSGSGFTGQLPEQLFDPYYSTRPDGMGLGLSISRSIVAAHHGQIIADHSPTGGAVFRVSLPHQSKAEPGELSAGPSQTVS